jgi:hypothetical protein
MVPDLMGFCPPVSSHSLVRPRAWPFFHPGSHEVRPSRTAALKHGRLRQPAGLVLDRREHDGRLVRVEIAGAPTLVLDGRQIPDRGMAAARIVEALQGAAWLP